MKRIIYILIALIACNIQLTAKEFTVVIDPGHGGKDPGAVGKMSQEKTINLNVALILGKTIKDNYPDVKIVYTRKTDKYVTLQDRPNIANKADGDLFISIHTNASESRSAYGAETFTLGLSKSNANFEVAKRENSVLLLEDRNKETYQGFDPTSPDSYIMFEFMQSKYIDQSVEIAYYIQREFVTAKRLDRGVRQAIFWVLHQVKMPSILIELGFITNSNEESYLISHNGQQQMAQSIFNAFEKYKHEYDKRTISNVTQEETIKPDKEPTTTQEKKEIQTEKKTEISNSKPAPTVTTNSTTTKSELIYKIRVFCSRKKLQNNDYEIKRIKKFQPITHNYENNWYKYMCGEYTTYKEASSKLEEIKSLYKDAFIVAYYQGKAIKIQDAIKIEKK